MPQATLTILICTHNRAKLLANVIGSLNRAQRPAGWEVEILVVANACTDGTHALLDGCRTGAGGPRLPLRWLAEPMPGKSHALNRARTELGGDWVAFVDDDHRVDEAFLAEIALAVARHAEATMLCGRILPDWDGSEPAWVHDSGPHRIYPLPIPRQDFGEVSREIGSEGPIPGGGNQIIRVDLLRQLGGFSTDLGPQGHDLGGGEDTEFMLRALRKGARLWYAPEVLQFHYVDRERLTLPYLMEKSYKRSAASIGLHGEGTASSAVPIYLYRKVLGYAWSALTSATPRRRRFYLVRCAAALGEMAGHRRLRHRPRNTPAAPRLDDV